MKRKKLSPSHVALFSVLTLGIFAVLYPLFEKKDTEEDPKETGGARQL